mmetsp:Transcript_43679/g.65968  ORF Transcript_43679/g.65968 Transcript_43679/m.65968 type:complete len:83 (-) Transcript_43679:1337-1585(-)|eukprot:6961415-Ditylum_brightwellii.AAC.1
MRADARLELIPPNIQGALEDIQIASSILPTDAKVWRVMADAQEANGDIKAAVKSVMKWSEYDPSFRTKAKKELSRLSSSLNC